ncbi:hypothetical protein LOTGIDRAFT_238696 [Lottia gigantea]|uniref:Replication protein A 14 kDa subunit n=1 Tax=Lottia gigantea TaxID=225164 RepID=V4ARA7_LOTGI|nr:hypothetical protein LOTGIDRAFT_238696 [Lottia gigantea]ESO99787.1 hypothetical protein LOTGIDRAFT_238696 [Lottia gigantea]
MDNFARPRINGAMLSSYQGRNVCLLGVAKYVDNSGKFFTIHTSDGQDVKVEMQEPLNEYVAGLTEVHGTVNKNSIVCENYIVFSDEASGTFNMELYNQAVELQTKLPNHYITGVTQE